MTDDNSPFTDWLLARDYFQSTLLATLLSFPILVGAYAFLFLPLWLFFVIPLLVFLIGLGYFLKLNWKKPHLKNYVAMIAVGFSAGYSFTFGLWLFVVWLVMN